MVLLSAALHPVAQPPQDRFVIASFADPPMTGNAATDDQTLLRFRDAYFNLMTGANDHNLGNASIRYKLERVAAIPPLPGAPPVRLIINDERLLYFDAARSITNVVDYDPIVRDNVINDWLPNPLTASNYQPFTAGMRNAVYGFGMPDEPLNTDTALRDRINQWVTGLIASDPSRVCYWNLGPYLNAVSPPTANPDAALTAVFQSYVHDYATGNPNPVIAFDLYPFLVMGTRGGYYLSHQIMADEARSAGKAYWATIAGIDSRQMDAASPGCATPVAANNYAPLTENTIRLQAYVPVVYGAKGITWFTYDTPPSNPCNWVYDPGMITPGSPLYAWVRSVNSALTNMGPALLNARWLATVHGDASDPFSDQENLPTPNSGTPVISGPIPGSFAIGIFGRSGTAKGNTLAILNKDPNNAGQIKVRLRRGYSAYRHAKQTNQWIKVSGWTKTIALTVQPGDMELIDLIPNDLVASVIRRKK